MTLKFFSISATIEGFERYTTDCGDNDNDGYQEERKNQPSGQEEDKKY